MDKSVIGLVAALGAAAPLAAAQASVVSSEDATSALRANSVAELLEPSPANAASILRALDAEAPPSAATAMEGLQVAQWHHHHHHHHFWHHHHHHHHWYHHHHHHHWWHHHHYHHHIYFY